MLHSTLSEPNGSGGRHGDFTPLAFEGARQPALILEEGLQRGEDPEREFTAFLVLRGAGCQPDLASIEVDLRPLERKHFNLPPSSERRKTQDRPQASGSSAITGSSSPGSKNPSLVFETRTLGMCGFELLEM